MRISFVVFLLLCPIFSQPVRAADEYTDCNKATVLDESRIENESRIEDGVNICTRLIKSGKWQGQELGRLLSNRANLYVKLKKYDLGLADLDQAIAINPSYVYAYDDRGDIWRLRGDYDKALLDYDQAIRIDENFLSAYFERGQVFEQMGNLARARAEYQLVLSKPGAGRSIDKWAKDNAREALDRLSNSR